LLFPLLSQNIFFLGGESLLLCESPSYDKRPFGKISSEKIQLEGGAMQRVVLTAVLFYVVTFSRADVVGTHQGANDPVTEGWQRIRSFGSVLTGAVINDSGLGIDSWKINDTATSNGIYGIQMTSQQLQSAAVNDFTNVGIQWCSGRNQMVYRGLGYQRMQV
jgi:hypothetical protein